MSDRSSPGVPVEERQPGPRPIEGVGTSTAGFAGIAERGPEYPCVTASWLEYQRWFGGGLSEAVSYLPHAARGFFENGGRQRTSRESSARTRVHEPASARCLSGQWVAERRATDLRPDPPRLGERRYEQSGPVPGDGPLLQRHAAGSLSIRCRTSPGSGEPDRREPDLVEQFDDSPRLRRAEQRRASSTLHRNCQRVVRRRS
jgi:hypothetical protein